MFHIHKAPMAKHGSPELLAYCQRVEHQLRAAGLCQMLCQHTCLPLVGWGS